MPGADVDALEQGEPGFLDETIADELAHIESRLTKRYVTPFSEVSPPRAVLRWLTRIVTLKAYEKRGFNPTSAQDQLIVDAATKAEADIIEAANSETGLFDLPLRQDAPGASGVSKGGPFGYSEQSPYVSSSKQRHAARDEDSRGDGS